MNVYRVFSPIGAVPDTVRVAWILPSRRCLGALIVTKVSRRRASNGHCS